MKGIIAERKARDKERKNKSEKGRTKSVNHVGTSMNAIIPRGVPSRGVPSRVQSMDDVKKKRPPPVKHSRKAKSLPPFVQMSPPSPQRYGRISPDLKHDKTSMFRKISENEPYPTNLRNPKDPKDPKIPRLTRRFRRMSRRFIWAEEPDVELKDPRNM